MSIKDKFNLSRLGKKQAVPLAPQGHPIFLLVGSLAGCSKKDALQYARGLAEQNIITPSSGRLNVFHDKARDRWVYEIHEGGIEFSIAEKVVAALSAGEQVRIALVNGAHISIEEAQGELFSLVNPKVEPVVSPYQVDPDSAALDLLPGALVSPALQSAKVSATPDSPGYDDVSKYASTTPLQEVFPMDTGLSKVGMAVLGVSGALFAPLGLAFALMQAGVFESDALLTLVKAGVVADVQDNPAMQLEKARSEAEAAGEALAALKKGPKGWSWEVSQ